MGITFRWDVFVRQLTSPYLLAAAGTTLWISLVALLVGMVGALVLAFGQESRWSTPRYLVAAYLWLFRGTPALLQLIFAFNVLPSFGLVLSGPTCAVLALGLNEAAYLAEILRSGIRAVGYGQRAAGRALGLADWQVMAHVVLPQAARVIVPPVGNQFIGMLKVSALVSVIGVHDLLQVAEQAASGNFRYLEVLSAAAAYYLAFTTMFMGGQRWLERRLGRRSSSVVASETGTIRDAAPGGHLTAPTIDMRRVRKSYGRREVLAGVDLRIEPGQCVVVMGPSGSGKSTLLRAMGLLEPVDSGGILFDGLEATTLARSAATRVRRRVGMVFQHFEMFEHLSLIDNLMLAPVRTGRMTRGRARAVGLHLLARVRLSDKAGHLPSELSGGERQRGALARALAMEPEILLCDELTSALDPETTEQVLRLMQDLGRDGMTRVVVTHEVDFARAVADQVVLMEAGRIVHRGTNAQFFGDAAPERVARFLRRVVPRKGGPDSGRSEELSLPGFPRR